jgi:PAS domain S-box-containing protein
MIPYTGPWIAILMRVKPSLGDVMGSEHVRRFPSITSGSSPLSTAALVCLVVALSYLAPKLEGAMMLNPRTVWPVWPGCAILVSILLLVRGKIWPILIPAAFATFALYDLEAGVPIRSIAWFIPANTVQVLTSALCLRYCFRGIPRLNSVKALAKYSFFAVILAPCLAAFFSAYGIEGSYWEGWRVCYLSEALAFVTLTPAILSWSSEGSAFVRKPRTYHLEAVALIAGLIFLSYLIFDASGRGDSPALLYSLIPFLLWAALRFGSIGISSSTVLVSFLAIWGAIHVRGPFADQGSLKGMLSLQLFLVFAALPFMVLAALAEERKIASRELKESEERFRLAAQAGKMYAYEWDVATDTVTRSTEHVGVLGFSDQAKQLTRQQLLARVHPDDRALFVGSVDQVSPENPTTHISYRMLRPDCSVVWLEKSARAFFDEQGKVLRMIGMVADITQRKQADEALAGVGRRLIEAQDQERTRIARELHDDIGQRLALLAFELDQLHQELPNPPEIRSRMGELQKQTSAIATDIQTLSHELHSAKLEYLGIAAAMRGFCKEFGMQQKAEIDFKTHDLPSPLSPDISLCLFRVLQEALHNSAKHSGVRHVEVQLWGTSDEIHLMVNDSGVGFDSEAVKESGGLGLISMEERLKLLKGTFSVESEPEGGTTIHARVPLSSDSKPMRAAG